MKLSIIWILAEREELNEKTFVCLTREAKELSEPPELIVYGDDSQAESRYEQEWNGPLIRRGRLPRETECYSDAAQLVSGELVGAVCGGDTFSEGAFAELVRAVQQYPKEGLFMLRKQMPDGQDGAFSAGLSGGQAVTVDLKQDYAHYPFYFGGTFVRAEDYRSHTFDAKLGLETERAFFLELAIRRMRVVVCPHIIYHSGQEREGNFTFFEDVYKKDWYEKSLDGFWVPFLQDCRKRLGEIPYFVQYHAMFTIRNRFSSNWNNRNKHIVTEGKEREVLEAAGRVLRQLDPAVIYNVHRLKENSSTDSLKWVYGILRNGEGFHFDRYYLAGHAYYGTDQILLNRISTLKTNILFMNYEGKVLHIDGTVHPILFSIAQEVYFRFNGKKYPLEYNGRYAHNKVFGVSVYKSHSFHVKLPMEAVKNALLSCFARVEDEEIRISFSYESHFSRMSGAFKNSYWCFGQDPMYLSVKEDEGIRVRICGRRDRRRQERRLSKEMLLSFSKRSWVFLALRKAYFILRPFMKRRPIWMYLDKIYKAGDSSEYLYRYACAQKDGSRHYYLVDKKAADYKRLRRDGYRPLVRGSIKHRLVFLMADMMVISNSTVFAFNNFGLPNSSYVRDLVDFHVCCVQHGMSVQKIAVAQNRLRDNTRLYFCASKYEIRNLSHPIYDYVGYDALKLTGVPRYDGLVNRDKKQILISPTWRMQAAVPVRTSEGEQRDYNPLFKESDYFRVYNALINDSRLIEAAKKYGYRIKYVLHPIVSAQADDFDRNDYVDVIPAVGDMSYEQMFCESSLMVTDFSGIQFDFAYMRKPLLYLHHRDIPQHYEEGTFHYDTMAFGEIAHDNEELIDLLCEYMAGGCQMKEKYVKRADDFFYFNDHENCKRIYNVMREYQETHIFHKEI